MGKCKCKNNPRIVSNVIQTMNNCQPCCDVCTNPICGDPNVLGIYAPVIYDEIGVNLCATFPLGTTIPTTYPTATSATAQVISATYGYSDTDVAITQIPGRPNCYSIVLRNITVQFAINIFDSNCRLLGTVYPTATYLPTDTGAETYDENTNPAGVELELFAPYGLAYYNPAAGTFAPAINFIGRLTGTDSLTQGVNLSIIPKVVDFDTTDSTVSVGVTMTLQSLYLVGYKVPTMGKIDIPKGNLNNPDNSDCISFVAGELLNLEIKPLDLGMPACQENLKNDCDSDNSCGGCGNAMKLGG